MSLLRIISGLLISERTAALGLHWARQPHRAMANIRRNWRTSIERGTRIGCRRNARRTWNVGRNAELIRQWTVLQRIGAHRGETIPKLARHLKVHPRTIRRDLTALQVVGFPIRDEVVNGTKFWRMDARPLGALARSSLTFAELSALYFSRALIACFAGTHLLADLQGALDKFEAALTPAMKKFLDRLPRVIGAKPEHSKRQDTQTYQITARLLDAILGQRVVAMRYHSF